MSGIIRVSENRKWMVAGWAFCGVLESALKHIPDSLPSLKALVGGEIKGVHYLDLETECTIEEVRVLLNAFQEGYKDTESAGASSFGDPSFYPGYMKTYDRLIRLVREELEGKNEGDQGGSLSNTHE